MGQRCTHADRMHPEPPRAPTGARMPQRWTETPTAAGDSLTPSTGAQGRHTLPKVVRGYPLTITRSQPHQTRHRPRRAADRPQGWSRAWHTVRATQRAHRAATGHDRGTGWAQIPLNKESTTTAPTEAHTAPQTVGGCHSPPTARNAPHRARRSPTRGTAWHGGTASAPRPDPAPQPTNSTNTTAEPQSRKPLKTQGFHSPMKKSCSI